jgi:hypothetical protein
MICDNSKGKLTYEEALHYDVGFLQYLWYIAMKEVKSKKAKELKQSEALSDSLEGG